MADAGEGSSSGAKRRRGPPQRPRGVVDPDAPPQPRLIHRRVTYRAAEVLPVAGEEPVPEAERDLSQHTILQFQFASAEYDRCQRFLEMEMLQHRTFDWELIGILGQRQRLEQMLGDRWRLVLGCEWPQYAELTVEFHSTWVHRSTIFDHPAAVSFSLGRRVFEMTIPEFAVALGFYTAEEVRQPGFALMWRGIFKKSGDVGVSEMRLRDFWAEIADGAYDTSVLESSIRDPLLRYIHRIMACTLFGRRSGLDKCSQPELFCLYCIVRGHEANLASVFLTSLASRPRRGGRDGRLDMGPYIGRLAESLGVFDRYPRESLTPGPATRGYSLQEMRKAAYCPWDAPPRWVPVRDAPPVAAGVIQRGVAPVDHRVAVRVEQAEQRGELPPLPLTLEDVRDQIFERIDRVEDRVYARMDRTDAAIRFMMSYQGIPIPDFFRAPDDLGGDRAGTGDAAGTSGAGTSGAGDQD